MKKKRNIAAVPVQEAPSPFQSLWLLPSAVFFAVPAAEIYRSLSGANFAERALPVHDGMLAALKWGCWAFAAALAFSPLSRKRLLRHLEGPGRAAAPWRQWGPLAVSLEFTALLCFLTYCRYRGSQFPLDTAAIVQRAFNTLHGRWFQTSIFGCSAFSYHVAFTLDLFSPLLLIWRSSLPFLMLQCLALGSMGLAVYHLVYRLSASSYAGFIGMLLVYSCPAYSQMCASRLDDSVFLAPFLLWALVFMEYERWFLCIGFMALAATTREHFPFTLMGLGVYAIFRRGKPTLSSSLKGGALIAGAVLLFAMEMKLIFSFPDTLGYQRTSWDGYFHRYHFAGSGHFQFAAFLLRHPLSALIKTVSPFQQVVPVLSLILYAALFPLAAPLQFIPFSVAVLPQMMTEPSPLHDMLFNYPSFVFGLLMFAAAHGIARVDRRLKNRGREEFLLLPVLLVCGFGFANSKNPIFPESEYMRTWFPSMPSITAQIPPNASLWADEYFATWTAARAQLKIIAGESSEMEMQRLAFTSELFKPEFILTQSGRIVKIDAPDSPLLLFLADNHYVRAAQAPGLILLRAPDYPHPGGVSPGIGALRVPTPEQQVAFNYFALRFWIRQNGRDPSFHPSPDQIRIRDVPLNLTPDQKRIVHYLEDLMAGLP